MSLRIFFISDNNLSHPILQAQGIPQILKNASDQVQFVLMTFENGMPADAVYDSLRNNLHQKKISHVPVYLPKNLFPSGRFWIWCLGIVKGIRVCIRFKPQIIHVRSYPPMFIALFLKRVFGVKVIFDMRGIYVDEEVEAGIIKPGSLLYVIERTFERLYLWDADVTIAVSHAHRDYITTLTSNPKFLEKNIIIPNCTDLVKFENVKTLRGIKKIRLLYIGQHIVKYDMDSLFDFFVALNSRCAESYLRIVTYWSVESLTAKMQRLPAHIRDRIEISAARSQEMPDRMNECSAGLIFLNPFVSNRVCAPIKLTEYLAAGLPIVVNEDVGDTESIINKYNVGIVVKNKNYDDAAVGLLELLKSPDIEKRCRTVVARDFNLSKSAESYMDIYRRLGNTGRKKSSLA
jgi:glycosyltransferase involved in cell wall biosynthesis